MKINNNNNCVVPYECKKLAKEILHHAVCLSLLCLQIK